MDVFYNKVPQKIETILAMLNNAGYEAYVVGGCVRDIILGKEPHDWDIATSATPQETKQVFKSCRQIDTGLKHGTVTIIMNKEMFEITTFRIDGEYSDGRRPDDVSYTTDLIKDLARRDFTINACALSKSKIIDPFGGQKDAIAKIIRCVGDPVQRFTEDALRILRGTRFASVLDFSVEAETKKAMLGSAELLKNVSQERITMEFCKTLCGKNVFNTLMEFRSILVQIIPETEVMFGFNQHNKHHIFNVFEHSLKAVEATESDYILRTCMLLHDIGKPACFSMDEKHVGHFYGHPAVSAQMAEKILQRMRFSGEAVKIITELVRYHDIEIMPAAKSIKKILGKLGEVQFRRLLKIKKADTLAQSPQYTTERLTKLNIIEKIAEEIITENHCISLRDLAIDGDDLIQLGIPKGKNIGIILNRLLEMVMDEEISNTRDSLLKEVEALKLNNR